ncbi:MAG: hypothetical protein ABIU54_13165 [Candidatus Eisenbacteria bacterium]
MAALIRITQRALALGMLTLALLAVGGCRNPFTPADPEPPAAGGVTEDFRTPAKLLDTITAALADKGQSGASAYINAFADSTQASEKAFYAFHWPAAIDAWRAVSLRDPPQPWDLTLERAFYQYLVGYRPTASYTLTWNDDPTSESDEIDLPSAPNLAVIHRRYTLYTSTSETDIAVIAIGYADLYLYKANGRWFIYRWQDRIDPDIGVNPTDPEQLSMGARRLEST